LLDVDGYPLWIAVEGVPATEPVLSRRAMERNPAELEHLAHLLSTHMESDWAVPQGLSVYFSKAFQGLALESRAKRNRPESGRLQ